MPDVRTVEFSRDQLDIRNGETPDDRFHALQPGSPGKAPGTVTAVRCDAVMPSGHGPRPTVIDELPQQLAHFEPALGCVGVVLEHITGNAEVVNGVVSWLLDFLELAGIEVVLARLDVYKECAALWASVWHRSAVRLLALRRPIHFRRASN